MGICFNTQPPEGGWVLSFLLPKIRSNSFNTQPPEGGWTSLLYHLQPLKVSTHSRLKAAGRYDFAACRCERGFNTQPPEGGWMSDPKKKAKTTYVSTHSRLKAAGPDCPLLLQPVCFNTQPPEGGWRVRRVQFVQPVFVSTHSRLKAAGRP